MDGFPSSLSDYRPVDLLGQGATANVFKAHWRRTGQVVALKVIRPDASRQTRAAFQQGLRAWREVKHPHVAALIDEGATADGALYAAAEYVPSCSLRLHQARKRDSGGSAALELMGQVLDALAAIHEAGHVHGDLHANNILITETGARANVKLIDFGAATPRGGASPSADLYAWALLTIECLTGWPVLGAEERYTAARSGNARLPNALAGHPLAPLLSAILDPAPRRVPMMRLARTRCSPLPRQAMDLTLAVCRLGEAQASGRAPMATCSPCPGPENGPPAGPPYASACRSRPCPTPSSISDCWRRCRTRSGPGARDG